MKRIVCGVFACFIAFAAAACGQKASEPTAETDPIFANIVETIGTESTEVSEMPDTGVKEGNGAAMEKDTFDFETKTVMPNSGYEMPIYGIGTYSLGRRVRKFRFGGAGKRRAVD